MDFWKKERGNEGRLIEVLETEGRTCGCTSLLVQEFVVKMY